MEAFRALARDPALDAKLTASLAPAVWCGFGAPVTCRGLEDVKRGLLSMLFGGNSEEAEDGRHTRGDISILLCGDPGTSKSQLLSCVHQLSPRGIYTSGKGSSAVGLTAYVTKVGEGRRVERRTPRRAI